MSFTYILFMKGAELSINALVIMVLALVILLGILALYFGVWSPGASGISLEAAKGNACRALMTLNCQPHPVNVSVIGFDADQDGVLDPPTGSASSATCKRPGDINVNDTLWSLCVCYYGLQETDAGANQCKQTICGCP